jgi:hypothetical protein
MRVGRMDPVMAARPTADAFSRANYLAAVAGRVDSYWVPELGRDDGAAHRFCGGLSAVDAALQG